MCKIELKNKNMEVNVEFANNVPQTITSDIYKIKQVVINLFSQSTNNQFRGFVKIKVGYLEPTSSSEPPYLTVDIENSKFEVKPQDAKRLSKFSQET